LMIPDRQATKRLGSEVSSLIEKPSEIENIGMAAHSLAKPKACENIVDQLISISK